MWFEGFSPMRPQSRTRRKPQLREKYINNKKEKTISKNLKNNDKTTFFLQAKINYINGA